MDYGQLHKEHRVCAIIDTGALINNVKAIRDRAKYAQIMAVVKSDAYGHGCAGVAAAIQDYVHSFAVATPEEGAALRKSGIGKPILVLGGAMECSYDILLEHSLMPCIYTLAAAGSLNEAAANKNKRVDIHIAVDTGMSRLGFYWDTAYQNIYEIAKLPNLNIKAVYSHLSCADSKDSAYTRLQIERFEKVKRMLKRVGTRIESYHIHNSAGLIEGGYLYDTVRTGILLYGLYPSQDVARIVGLQPIMSIISHISHLHTVPAGSGIGYGATHIVRKKTKIATVPVGYADGYPRLLSNKARVIINNKSAPVIGRICMEHFMVDVTGFKAVKEGDMVILLGGEGANRITADELAAHAQTINYEIVSGIAQRVPRIFV